MALCSAQSLRDEVAPSPLPQIVEHTEDGVDILLLPDRGRSGVKLFQCIKTRLPSYPEESIIDLVVHAQTKFLRIVGDSYYVPAVLLTTSCNEPSMGAFLDHLDIPSQIQWQALRTSAGSGH